MPADSPGPRLTDVVAAIGRIDGVTVCRDIIGKPGRLPKGVRPGEAFTRPLPGSINLPVRVQRRRHSYSSETAGYAINPTVSGHWN